jgi:hypothetical protein
MLKAIYFARKADASIVASWNIWQESARNALLRKSNKGDKRSRTFSSLELPWHPPDRLNQVPKSDLDVLEIFQMDLNVVQLHNRRSLLTSLLC